LSKEHKISLSEDELERALKDHEKNAVEALYDMYSSSLYGVISRQSALTVAFSPVHKRVMIDMANMKMPVNDNAHQYHLWALVGGKPVNLGVFDSGTDTLSILKR